MQPPELRFCSGFVTEIRPDWQQTRLSFRPTFLKNISCHKRKIPKMSILKTIYEPMLLLVFPCLPSLFQKVSVEERAAGRGGWQVGDSAGHVTEKSKGMYLKVSSRLATSTAHRPHLPAGLAQRSRPGSGRSRSSPVCLRSLRVFFSLFLFLFFLSPGTVAKPAAIAATAAHTGESHPGPMHGSPSKTASIIL